MFKIKIATILIFTITMINAQEKYPIINPEFERFDMERFEKTASESTWEKQETLPGGTSVFYQQLETGFTKFELPSGSYFNTCRYYYPNGQIECKGLGFIYQEFRKGVWYFYDENGSLIEEIDYDKPFKYTFEQVMEFAKKEGADFRKSPVDWSQYTFRPALKRYDDPEECYWELRIWNTKQNKIEIICHF